MREHQTEKGLVVELTMGDKLIFKHGFNVKIYTVEPNEKLFLIGKLNIERVGLTHQVTFTDPMMDLQFDEMGIMADLNVVINTNIINAVLVFSTLDNAKRFLEGSKDEELIRETINLQSKISRVPVVFLGKAL